MERKKLNEGKVTGTIKSRSARTKSTNEKLALIVKVKEPGYVPEGFQVRTRINEYLFTAEGAPAAVQSNRHNDAIESISINEPLQMID